ncbi:membrane protein insertase YidC [Rhodocista pekingensis]|uniref:Membrane protein insertase YidC n=1 Tax=Rhodocista pekingensis TaxID=201185 RepID=A0ABW2KX40_9PROT
MTDQKNLILAIVISVAILFGFNYFYERPRQQALEEYRQQQAALQAETAPAAVPGATVPGSTVPGSTVPGPAGDIPVPAPGAPAPTDAVPAAPRDRGAVLGDSQRVQVDTPRLHGSVNLRGGRIDDLTLANYHVTPDKSSPEVVLLSPVGTSQPYFAEFGWVPTADAAGQPLPGPTTDWQPVSQGSLTPDNPVVLRWDNGQGLVFEREIAIDRDYMFTVTQRVTNQSGQPVTLHPYGFVQRRGTPTTSGFFILHEGALGVFDGTLREFDYSDLKDSSQPATQTTTGGWFGFTDKYWLVTLVPDQASPVDVRVLHQDQGGQPLYQVDFRGQGLTVAPGATAASTHRLFAGAKIVRTLDAYESELGITRFSYAVDWGWFYFLTKPFFYGLDLLGQALGNFGIAILVFTVLLRLAFFPLANKQYKAFAKMKLLQPKMEELRKRHGDDRQKLSMATMELYKQEKVNPLSGCLPILLQIPVFFALYKVLFVTIEMRHAPFYGWITDLSAPDPTTVFNLFGLIPWSPPGFLMVGALPLMMGFTMWLQQKISPANPDPIQQRIFMVLPFLFTYMMAAFPAGLVIYWTWSNLLAIAQQWYIMRRMGMATKTAPKKA